MIPKVIDIFSSNFHYCDFGYIDGSMDAGRELLGLVMERAFTTESLFSQMEDLGHTKGLVSSTEELCKL